MPPQSQIQTNFTSGELSPLMRGRVDVNKYSNGVEVLKNMVVRPQGGATRRMGTQYVTNAYAATKVRLREFIVSNSNPYVLEFGVSYVRIFKNGVVLAGSPILVTPYQAADLNNLSFCQVADVMFIACQGYQPQVLTKFSDTSWSFAAYTTVDGPYLPTDQSGNDLTASNYTDVGLLTGAAAATFEISGATSFTGSGFSLTGYCPIANALLRSVFTTGITPKLTCFGQLSYSGSGSVTGNLYLSTGEIIAVSAGTITGMTGAYTVNVFCKTTFVFGTTLHGGGAALEINAVVTGANYRGNLYFLLVFPTNAASSCFMYSISGATLGDCDGSYVASNATLYFVDYWAAGQWNLLNVTGTAFYGSGSTLDGSSGVGNMIPNVLSGVNPQANITFSATSKEASDGKNYTNLITSSLSEVFDYTNVGMYLRTTDGTWYLITSFISDSNLQGTPLTMLTVSPAFPQTILTEQCRVAWLTINSASPLFATTDINRQLRLNFSSTQVWVTLTDFASSTQMVAILDMTTSPSPLDPSNGKLPAVAQTVTGVTTTVFQPATQYTTNYTGAVVRGGTTFVPITHTTTKKTKIPLDPVNYSSLFNSGVPDNWRLGAWSNTTGWPSVVFIHQDRLTWACSPIQPNSWWASNTDDYYNMAPTAADSTVTDANAITFTIASSKVDSINWGTSGQVLLMGTDGAEYVVQPDSTATALTPSDCDCNLQTPFGSRRFTESHRVGIANIFVDRSGTRVREQVYNFQFNIFEAHDLTVASEHILRRGGYIVKTTFQLVPYSIYWCLLNDGTLASLTYEHDQQVIAWAQHSLGSNDVPAIVESFCCIPSADGTWDQLWLSVQRTINGSVVRTIEIMAQDFSPIPQFQDTSGVNAYHLDCGVTVSGAPTGTLTVPAALNGETFSVFADGVYQGDLVVTAGAITLPEPFSVISVGYSYGSRVRVLPLEGSGPLGTTQGDKKRVHWLILRLLNTLAFSYGKNLDKQLPPNLNDLGVEDVGNVTVDTTGSQIPQYLLTKDVRVSLDNNITFEGQYEVNSVGPYPLTVLALITKLKTAP